MVSPKSIWRNCREQPRDAWKPYGKRRTGALGTHWAYHLGGKTLRKSEAASGLTLRQMLNGIIFRLT